MPDTVRGSMALADDKPMKRKAGVRVTARARRTASSPEREPGQERRLVDVDPWSMFLDQLTEMPEERAPAARNRPKRK